MIITRMKQVQGFTLVELLVILVVIAITVAFGMPQIANLLNDNRKIDALNRLSANLTYARSEAVKRAASVTVTPLAADNWKKGWRIYIDVDGDGTYDDGSVDEADKDELLRIEDDLQLPSNISLSCGCGNVVFNPEGSIGAADIIITLNDTDPNIDMHTELRIYAIGRVSIGDPIKNGT